MALQIHRIPFFSGIDQSVTENRIDAGASPDACNMDTRGGILRVARGYALESDASFPAGHTPVRLYVWNRSGTKRFLAATKDALYALDTTSGVWSSIYAFSGQNATAEAYEFLPLKIGSTEYLLVANGLAQMVKWDGVSASATLFGSAEGLSDVAARYAEVYFARLFCAGVAEHPSRLYWSQAPGDSRSVENWASVEASENVGGGHVEVGTDSDPITGLVALSNQLLIFKRDSLYRLLGDRPSNYRVQPVDGTLRQSVHTAGVRAGDVLCFLTKGGLYYFDGQSVKRMRDADKVRGFLEGANLDGCLAAAVNDTLYFAVREGDEAGKNDAMLVYDMTRGAYMVRRGFGVRGMCASGGTLYIIDHDGRVCRFDEGDDYAGARIEAYWKTPLTDLDVKVAIKRLVEAYLRGSGGVISLEAETESGLVYAERLMPARTSEILELKLTGQGRAFRLVVRNINGLRFSIEGGMELLLDVQRRVL